MNIQFVCILVTVMVYRPRILHLPTTTPPHPSQVRSVYELLHKTTDNICTEHRSATHNIYIHVVVTIGGFRAAKLPGQATPLLEPRVT